MQTHETRALAYSSVLCRCLFNVTYFADDNSLHLVGMSVLRAQRSAFTRQAWEEESEACPDALPCDDDDSNDDDSDAGIVTAPMTWSCLLIASILGYTTTRL